MIVTSRPVGTKSPTIHVQFYRTLSFDFMTSHLYTRSEELLTEICLVLILGDFLISLRAAVLSKKDDFYFCCEEGAFGRLILPFLITIIGQSPA